MEEGTEHIAGRLAQESIRVAKDDYADTIVVEWDKDVVECVSSKTARSRCIDLPAA